METTKDMISNPAPPHPVVVSGPIEFSNILANVLAINVPAVFVECVVWDGLELLSHRLGINGCTKG